VDVLGDLGAERVALETELVPLLLGVGLVPGVAPPLLHGIGAHGVDLLVLLGGELYALHGLGGGVPRPMLSHS
jgi:hypothetical protein